MIEIRISESLIPEDPNQPCIRLSDYGKFLDGFRQLCQKTNMHNIDITCLNSIKIPTTLRFDDGTYVGIGRLFEEIGFKENNPYKE